MSKKRLILQAAGLILAALLCCYAYARSPAGLFRRGMRDVSKNVTLWQENESFFDELAAASAQLPPDCTVLADAYGIAVDSGSGYTRCLPSQLPLPAELSDQLAALPLPGAVHSLTIRQNCICIEGKGNHDLYFYVEYAVSAQDERCARLDMVERSHREALKAGWHACVTVTSGGCFWLAAAWEH